MMRRGTREPKAAVPVAAASVAAVASISKSLHTDQHNTRTNTGLRGLLKLLQGQIPSPIVLGSSGPFRNSDINISNSSNNSSDANDAMISVYRYHGPTLRNSQKELSKKKHKRKSRRGGGGAVHRNGDDGGGGGGNDTAPPPPLLLHSKHSTNFETAVGRHKFVAFFVVQGFQNARGAPCYSAHTLNLRSILATEYHDVMTTFVLDLGGGGGGSCGATTAIHDEMMDEECGGQRRGGGEEEDESDHHPFCTGTGFGLFPTGPHSTPTVLALLNVTQIPSIVVLDAVSGRIVAGDAIPAVERNTSHSVVNRWQSGKPGLSLLQQMGAVATCSCSHGPCCGGGSGSGGCVIQ